MAPHSSTEKAVAPHSSTLAWKIPWTEEPGRLQFMGSLRVGHGDVTNTGAIPGSGRSLGEGNGNPLQYSCLENSIDREAWWATVFGVTKSRTWLSNCNHWHSKIYSAINLLILQFCDMVLGVRRSELEFWLCLLVALLSCLILPQFLHI